MNIGIKDIHKAVRPLKNRIHLNNAILCVATGILTASGISFVLAVASLFIPVIFVSAKIKFIYLSCFLLALLISVFLRPRNTKVLYTADSLGLQERLTTAHEMKDDHSPLALLQRNNALKFATSTNFKVAYPIKFPLKLMGMALVVALLTGGIHLIPSPAKENSLKVQALKKEIYAQAEKINNERKELVKQSGISPEKLKEFNKKIDQLLKELKKSDSEDTALKTLSKAKNDLLALKNKKLNDELMKAVSSFRSNTIADSLAKGTKSNNKDEIRKSMEELKKKINQMNNSDKKKLAEEAEKLLSKMSDNKDVMKSLNQLAQALASGDNNAIADGVSSLENAMSAMMSSNSNADGVVSQATDKMASSLDNAKYEIAQMEGNADLSTQEITQDSSQDNAQSGNASGENGGATSNGKGGSGNKGGGGGAGYSTTNKDGGYTGLESGNSSREKGEKEVKDFESIYVPERLGGDSKQSQIKGHKNKSGQSQWKESQAPVDKGSVMPYNEVLGEYKNEAITSIQGDSVPPVMKDIVRDYFSSLE